MTAIARFRHMARVAERDQPGLRARAGQHDRGAGGAASASSSGSFGFQFAAGPARADEAGIDVLRGVVELRAERLVHLGADQIGRRFDEAEQSS